MTVMAHNMTMTFSVTENPSLEVVNNRNCTESYELYGCQNLLFWFVRTLELLKPPKI